MQERRIYFSNNHFQNITNQYNSIKIKYVREGKGSGQEPVSGRGQEHGKGQLNRAWEGMVMEEVKSMGWERSLGGGRGVRGDRSMGKDSPTGAWEGQKHGRGQVLGRGRSLGDGGSLECTGAWEGA